MKKFYSLFLLLPITLVFGQNLLTNGDLEQWGDSATPTAWTHVESVAQESTNVHGGSFSAMHTGGTSDLGQTVVGITPGNTYNISIWYQVQAGTGDGTDARIWSYWRDADGTNITDESTDGALRGPDNGYFETNDNQWTEYNVDVVAPAGATSLYFELRTYSSAVTFWDDLSVTCVDCDGTTPTLNVTSPVNGATLAVGTTDVTVEFTTNNFTIGETGSGADGHLHYSLDGGSTVMYYSADPFTVSGLSTGEHTVNLWLVDNSHQPLDPAVETSVTFTIPGNMEVNSIAELRAGAQDGTVYTLTSEAIVTMQLENRNQKYIQDDTAGILIDDNAGTITTAYNRYDGITGISGTLSTFRGMLQFVPSADPGAATSTDNTVTPQEITPQEFNANQEMYESELIRINNSMTDTTGNWEGFTSYQFMTSDIPEDTYIVYTAFGDANYIDTTLPTTNVDLVGVSTEFNGTAQLTPRDSDDIISSLGVNEIGFDASSVKVASKNNILHISGFEAKNVSIYNINGQLVAKSTQIGKLNIGTYIAVLTNAEGQKVSVKFIKK